MCVCVCVCVLMRQAVIGDYVHLCLHKITSHPFDKKIPAAFHCLLPALEIGIKPAISLWCMHVSLRVSTSTDDSAQKCH